MITALLTVLVLSSLLLLWVWLGNRRDEREWQARSRRLHDPRSMIHRSLIDYDPDAFEFRPGAMWPVDDPSDVEMLSGRAVAR